MRLPFLTLLVSAIFWIASGCFAAAKLPDLDFEKVIFEYSAVAKEISKRQISQDDEIKLVNMATTLIEGIKKQINADDVLMQYMDGSSFPNMTQHVNSGPTEKLIVRFVAAIHNVYKILSKELLTAIIRKSPLELTPLLRELCVFSQFVTANPRDYGHGVFSERRGRTIIVFATDNALSRIMKPIILKRLFVSDPDLYKMSRITTALCKANESQKPLDVINLTMKEMKRNTADDTRIPIAAVSLWRGKQ
ncbi:MAG: hypothetical protein LBJ42_01100 [Holosporales bacterium]|jgi:hypothetical protein|nr:hypothetical protein [Holosporales bacterium]